MKEERKILTYFVFAIFLFFSTVKVFLFPQFSLTWHVYTSIFGLIAMIPVAFTIWGVDIVLDRFYPYERNLRTRIAVQVLVSLVIIFFIRYIFYLTFHQFIPVPLTTELIVTITIIHILFVASIILTIFLFRFFNKWRETEIKKEILEKEKATVQYDNLKNQLNPHFLFNSLTSLNSLIFENPQLASEFLQQLSKVYRYVLENKDKTLVTVGTELKFIDNYIKLLKSRFDSGLVVNIQITDTTMDRSILPVTLQILIENAIKHNTTAAESPLCISIYDEEGYLIVRNNLQIKNSIESSNKQGLANLKNLYSVLIAKEITIESTADTFLIKVPLI